MKFVLPGSLLPGLARLVAAAALIAVIAAGAPLHSHDLLLGSDDAGSPQKTPCAACATGASPALIADRADFVPCLQSAGLASAVEASFAALSLPTQSGRAPPAV